MADLSTLSSLSGLYGGVRRGGIAGSTSAAANAAKLAGASGLLSKSTSSALSGAGGAVGGGLGVYSGLKQGGVSGYGNAAINATQLGSKAGLLSEGAGTAASYAAIPLSLYNEVKGWESGNTGKDALQGAETGAAIGTAVLPVFGTAIGAVLGGAAGAISSAFGGGRVDPENKPFNAYTEAFNKAPPEQKAQLAASVQNPYVPLAGYFDLRKGQLKGANPLYDKYGRKGEGKFTQDLIGKVQSAMKTGRYTRGPNGTLIQHNPGGGMTIYSAKDAPGQIYANVVQPWIDSMGTWQDSNKQAISGLIQNMTGQIMNGTYQQNFKAIGGDTPFAQVKAGSLQGIPGAMRRAMPIARAQ